MKRIHLLLTLSSLNVVLVTIERYSFTTKILLQPYSFLRLHELVQMTTLILFTVLIPAFLLKEVTDNFKLLQTKKGQLWGLVFLIAVYFYATGNGLHEVASFLFNTFCDTKKFTSTVCGAMFFNDYYTGNIIYFIGAYLMNLVIIVFELMHPRLTATKKDLIFVSINALVYALAIFAYAAFDRVLVGMVYSLISMITADILMIFSRKKIAKIPLTFYFALSYSVGTLAALIARFP